MRPLIPLALAAASCAFLTTACGGSTPAATVTASAPATTVASSAAPTATATVTKTASATATTTATSTATSSSTAATGNAGIPALTQQYCTKTQKVCFNYPAGYKVVSNQTAAGGLPGEQGHVDDAQGDPVMYFADGVGGVGGGCDSASMKEQTVVASLPTQIKGLPASSEFDNPDVHLVQAVIQPASGSGYIAQEYLSRAKSFATPGTVRSCGENFSDLILAPGGKGSVHLGVYQFADQQALRRYDTAAEAKQALATPQYVLAATMMQTATIS